MSNPMIRIHDMATGQIVDRQMTDKEFSSWQAQQTQNEIDMAEQAAKGAARATALAKLEALGLTPAEVAALIGA